MKKFAWRLQRVLDIREKQEDMQRLAVAEVSERMERARGELRGREEKVRQRLAEVGKCQAGERLRQQAFVMEALAFANEQMDGLKKLIGELERKKAQELEKLLKMRRFRLGLEKLRESAKAEHDIEVKKFEQAATDDATGISYARKLIEV